MTVAAVVDAELLVIFAAYHGIDFDFHLTNGYLAEF